MNQFTDRIAKLSPAKRALLELALKQNQPRLAGDLLIPRRAGSGPVALSFAQQRLWFLNQLEPDSAAYNQPKTIRLNGTLDIEALKSALNVIVARHEALRTVILSQDYEAPVQLVSEVRPIALPIIDLTECAKAKSESELQSRLLEAIEQPFDLSRDLLLRAMLVKLAAADHVLLLVTHHIASDGWSGGILWQELTTLYGAFSRAVPNPLPDLPIQYADYAVWQRQWLQGEVLEKQLSYWKQQLAGISALELPTDRPPPAVQTYRGSRQSLHLSNDLAQGLKALSRKQGVTLFMTLLAAFQTLLYRYSGQVDIAVGSPIAGRTRSETEGLIGFFVNTQVIRTDLSGNPTFNELLDRVRKIAIEAYEHQDIPFEKLVEELHPDRDLSRSPLFQVLFAFQNLPRQTRELPGLTVSPVEITNETAKFDLSLYMWEELDALRTRWEYNMDLFDGVTIERMLGHFETLLQGIVANPEQHIADLPILTETERHKLLVEWNDTQRDFPKDKCIHELFEEQVDRSPDAVAEVFEDKQLTYRELNKKANQLASYLRKLGVGPKSFVGFCVERSLDMVVGLLGILKAGGAYVPLDPAYPKERLEFMLQDAQVQILLTEQRLLSELPANHGVQLLCLDTDWAQVTEQADTNLVNMTTSEELAYVIYTSGSTGKPKGVQITHGAVVNLLSSMRCEPGLASHDTLLAVTTLSFDIAGLEIFLPLTVGARTVLVARDVAADGGGLAEKLSDSCATIMQATPATWRMLVEAGWRGAPHLKILCGGETLPPELAGHLVTRSSSLWNMYGPTETTIWSSIYRVQTPNGNISIGRPIANTRMYVLDRYQQPLPLGVPGELHIGGSGLARGYVNRPELTDEKFIRNPFTLDTGDRLYKTGDIARWLPDGNIEILSRLDNQVKIRGFRIELGEIEAVLGQNPAVRECVVTVRESASGGKQLVSFVVPRDGQIPTPSEFRDFLRQKLPAYMLPSAFVFLESLPLTPNGKVDRKALPEADKSRSQLEEPYAPPRTAVEKLLEGVWADVLKLEQIGIHDNFFDLGGHSLLGIKLISQLRRTFGADLPVRTLFEAPTIAQLAARLERQTKSLVSSKGKATYSHLVELRSGANQTPIFCLPYRCGVQGEYTHFLWLAQYLSKYSFYGLQAKAADSHTPPPATVQEMATNYVREIEDFEPQGPYYLIGDCAGAPEAYETARQLWTRGGKVGLLVLLDARGPYLEGRYWRLGSYTIRDLDLLRTSWLRSRLGIWCKNLAAAISFHWQESKKLPMGERRGYLAAKAYQGLKFQFLEPQMPSPEPWQELEEDSLSESETQLLDHIAGLRRRYRSNWPNDYGGRLAVIVNNQWYGFDRTYGWAGMAGGGVETYGIPGDHISYMLSNVPLVADRIRVCIEKAQKET